jgi:hypothetical protein
MILFEFSAFIVASIWFQNIYKENPVMGWLMTGVFFFNFLFARAVACFIY